MKDLVHSDDSLLDRAVSAPLAFGQENLLKN